MRCELRPDSRCSNDDPSIEQSVRKQRVLILALNGRSLGFDSPGAYIFVLTMTGGVEHVHSRWLDRAGFNLFVQAIGDLMAQTNRARMLRLEISQG